MIYAFEEIGPDLARPPLAARRALLGSGVAVPLETWQSLPLPARQTIVAEGLKDAVSEFVVKNAVSPVLKRIRFMGPVKDPPFDSIPPSVNDALRSVRPLTIDEWKKLRPIDRYALVACASNSRLLYRAIEEMTSGPSSSLSATKLRPWIGPLASAEVHMNRSSIGELMAGRVQTGQAIVLARTAGVRAARIAHEILDGYAEKYAGPVEVDARIDAEVGGCVWQAHVSTLDGEFFAAASVFAAAAAAVALRDAIAQKDPTASVENLSLREAAWNVGSGAFGDEATIAMSAKAYGARPNASGPLPAASSPNVSVGEDAPAPVVRRTGVPAWVAVLLVLSTLLAFGVTAVTIQKHGGLQSLYH